VDWPNPVKTLSLRRQSASARLVGLLRVSRQGSCVGQTVCRQADRGISLLTDPEDRRNQLQSHNQNRNPWS